LIAVSVQDEALDRFVRDKPGPFAFWIILAMVGVSLPLLAAAACATRCSCRVVSPDACRWGNVRWCRTRIDLGMCHRGFGNERGFQAGHLVLGPQRPPGGGRINIDQTCRRIGALSSQYNIGLLTAGGRGEGDGVETDRGGLRGLTAAGVAGIAE
jgi:hypothetical protein